MSFCVCVFTYPNKNVSAYVFDLPYSVRQGYTYYDHKEAQSNSLGSGYCVLRLSPISLSHYIPHNPPRTRAHCHLITLSIIFQSAGKTNSAPVFNKLEAIGVSKKPLI